MTPLEQFEILEGISSENFTSKDWARFERFKEITVDDIFGEEKEDFVQKHKEEALHDYGWCKGNVILPEETTAEYIDKHLVASLVEVVKQKFYSEEEVIHLLSKRAFDLKHKKNRQTTLEWFEEFKKK